MLGLMDVVFASSSATFHVPFTALALTPEACSSRTFPRFQQIEQNQGSYIALVVLLSRVVQDYGEFCGQPDALV